MEGIWGSILQKTPMRKTHNQKLLLPSLHLRPNRIVVTVKYVGPMAQPPALDPVDMSLE